MCTSHGGWRCSLTSISLLCIVARTLCCPLTRVCPARRFLLPLLSRQLSFARVLPICITEPTMGLDLLSRRSAERTMNMADGANMQYGFSPTHQQTTCTPKARRQRAFCSTVDACTTAAVPQPLQQVWDAWHVVSTTPDSRAARVDAARRAIANGTLCLDAHILAVSLLRQSTAGKHTVSSSVSAR